MSDPRTIVARLTARFRVTLADDGGPVQRLQGEALAGEIRDQVERMQDYGFSSHPLPGAEGLMLSVAGSRSQAVALAVGDRRWRLHLAPGEAAVHDDQGQVVHLTRSGIRVFSPLGIWGDAPQIHLSATDQMTLSAPRMVLASDDLHLGAEGGQPVARHDDPVASGKVVASTGKVKAG